MGQVLPQRTLPEQDSPGPIFFSCCSCISAFIGSGCGVRRRCGCARLLGCAPLQQRQLFSRRNLIEVFGFAAGFDVQIGVIAGCSLGLHRIVLIIRGQLLDLIVDLLADQVALLDPAGDAGCGAHFDEAAIMVENFDAVSVLYYSGFLEHGSHVVAQDGLNGGNVGGFQHVFAAAIAG